MALAAVTSGSNATALSVQQIINLLTGAMTDQPVYIANTIRAGGPGATAFAAFLGGITTGTAPSTGAHVVGEFLLDITNGIFRMCTAAGSPGTWTAVGTVTDSTSGDYASLVAAGAAAVAGAVGKAADAGHQHPGLVNPAGGYTGKLLQAQLAGVDQFAVDQLGFGTFRTGLFVTTPGAGGNVPTTPSANGVKIWIQTTDPGASAANGDIWINTT
jgi:hypothetical protein